MNGILFHTSIYSYILFSNLHGLWQIYSIITRAMLPMTMGNLKITVFYLSIYIFFTLWALFWKNVALCMKNLGTFVFKITKPFLDIFQPFVLCHNITMVHVKQRCCFCFLLLLLLLFLFYFSFSSLLFDIFRQLGSVFFFEDFWTSA